MNWNHLAIFHAVAEERSITNAAKRLFISQPAVSKQLAELEKTLGVRLFDRAPRGVELTEAGKLLYSYSQRLFALESEMSQALQDLKTLERGFLSIGASTTIGAYLLPEVLVSFHELFPHIAVGLEIGNTQEIQDKLLQGKVDMGLTEGFVENPQIEAEVFFYDEIIAIAAPHHPIFRESPITLERLCQEPFVMRESGSGTRAVIEMNLAERGLEPEIRLALGSPEAVKRAVATGIGVALVSRWVVGAEVEAGYLQVIPVIDHQIFRPLHHIRQRGRYESHAIRAFWQHLQDKLEKSPAIKS